MFVPPPKGSSRPLHSTLLSPYDVDDLTRLNELTPDTVLQSLVNRYARGAIYTSIGSILLVVNPYETIEGMYSEAKLQQMVNDALTPHHPSVAAVLRLLVQSPLVHPLLLQPPLVRLHLPQKGKLLHLLLHTSGTFVALLTNSWFDCNVPNPFSSLVNPELANLNLPSSPSVSSARCRMMSQLNVRLNLLRLAHQTSNTN